MKKFLAGSGLVLGGIALATYAAYRYAENKTKNQAREQILVKRKEIWESLMTLAQAEEAIYKAEGKYTDDIKKIQRYAHEHYNKLDEKVQIIINNEIPVAMLELSDTTDKTEASFDIGGFGISSECLITGNVALIKGGSPSDLSWKVEEPNFKLLGANRSQVQKALIRKAASKL